MCVESDQLTDFQELNVINPLHRSIIITNLQNDTTYVLIIWAVNSAGRGAVAVIENTTLPLCGEYSQFVLGSGLRDSYIFTYGYTQFGLVPSEAS